MFSPALERVLFFLSRAPQGFALSALATFCLIGHSPGPCMRQTLWQKHTVAGPVSEKRYPRKKKCIRPPWLLLGGHGWRYRSQEVGARLAMGSVAAG